MNYPKLPGSQTRWKDNCSRIRKTYQLSLNASCQPEQRSSQNPSNAGPSIP